MAALRTAARSQVGSAAWISEERASALQIAESEAEEFTFSARNELDWLNEHMAEIFNENQLSVTDIFKTPGKLRGKTPRTARKRDPVEARAPLSDLFSATPKAAPSPFRQQNVTRHVPTFQVAEDPVELPQQIPAPKVASSRGAPKTLVDSGYHGSQASVATEADERADLPGVNVVKKNAEPKKLVEPETTKRESDDGRMTEGSFQTAKEEQTMAVSLEEHAAEVEVISTRAEQIREQSKEISAQTQASKSSPPKPAKDSLPTAPQPERPLAQIAARSETDAKDIFDDIQSPSDESSPIRVPLVRKSSLTFASLPAREPLTKHSIGNRVSRTSHVDQAHTNYFGRSTGGKSLGNTQQEGHDDEDEMDIDVDNGVESDAETKITRMHNKTSTQRLQDQISKLGQSQSQPPRPSKSIPNLAAISCQTSNVVPPQETRQVASPQRSERSLAAPGAFPDDEDDDWIGPPNAGDATTSIFSPRPVLNKGYTTEVMESIHGKENISGSEFNIPKQKAEDSWQRSPFREPDALERTTSTLGHIKSASTSVLRSPIRESEGTGLPLQKSISVSHPYYDETYSPGPKSPSRSFRDSPLKAAKDKVSSILKTSRNLFASSAAVSAAAKGSAMSPPPKRPVNHETNSFDDLHHTIDDASLYPSLNKDSPSRLLGLGKNISSTDVTDKKTEREAREVQKMEERLEKLREKEAQKAREFSQQEQERVAAMEKQILAKKEQERLAKASQAENARVTRSSPRKTKAQLEAEGIAAAAAIPISIPLKDVEMTEAPTMVPAEAPRVATNPREPAKRPVKPAKETMHAVKQAPVVIRVDTGSQRNPQRNLFHPSNAALAGTLQESLAPAVPVARPAAPQPAVKTKANTASVRPKASTSSMKSVSTATGKLKVLETAAKKKEQDEQEAQRKRNLKMEMDRKRTALQEGKQQEQQRQNEVERQREKENGHIASQMNTKKAAQQTLEKRMEIERAKQQRAPAPAPRSQFGTELAQNALQDKPLPHPPANRGELGQARPVSRVESAVHRPEDDFGRSVTSTLQNTTKAPPKRPLPQDNAEEMLSRPTLQRNAPSNHAPDAKRRKTIEDYEDEVNESQPKGHMAPPVRQSTVRQKDGPNKSLFPNGYVNAPPPAQGAPLLHKATLNAQQMHRAKPAHPMDMVQNSKAPINFAPNPSQAASASHKTPARPVGAPMNAAKSSIKQVARSSPRYQNGDSIDLPEIPTDSEDEDSEDEANNFPVPSWADSPALRQGLMMQENLDPVSVFGLPGEIKLEEVFKNTDRHPRFRARTSSANWSGSDRLTEEEVKRDLEARDRLRREGGWSYGLS